MPLHPSVPCQSIPDGNNHVLMKEILLIRIHRETLKARFLIFHFLLKYKKVKRQMFSITQFFINMKHQV